MSDNQACPHCHSDSLQKRGLTKAEEPKQQYACNECGKWFLVSLVEIDDDIEFLLTKSQIAALEKQDRFFVTCSQNNTPVDKGFWAAVGHYRKRTVQRFSFRPSDTRTPHVASTPRTTITTYGGRMRFCRTCVRASSRSTLSCGSWVICESRPQR